MAVAGSAAAQTELAPVLDAPLPDLVAAEIVNGEEGLEWALVLGKALFWEQQVGSDGMACASCHFSAGADSRLRNQLNPGTEGKFGDDLLPDHAFGGTRYDATGAVLAEGVTASGAEAGGNYHLTADDFPFHQLFDNADRNSQVEFDMNDRASSQGSFENEQRKTRINRLGAFEVCKSTADVFHASFGHRGRDKPVRAVEPRNTPTTINSVFNFNNFWDGRASNIFNGKDVLGKIQTDNDPTIRIVETDGAGGFSLVRLDLPDSSLASQAVGPPLSAFEMSCDGREWPFIGAKMLNKFLQPLAGQAVSPDDSVLGPYAAVRKHKHSPRRVTGLDQQYGYMELVKKAFNPKYWESKGYYLIKGDGEGGAHLKRTGRKRGFTQAELNFSMFYGLSVMLYEATLISDQSRFDTALANNCVVPPVGFGGGWDASGCVAQNLLTELESDGANLFTAAAVGPGAGGPGGNCALCHDPLEMFSDAAYFAGDEFDAIEAFPGTRLPHDTGWNNIGARHTREDLANGADYAGDLLSVKRSVTLQARDWLIADRPEQRVPFFYESRADPEICIDFPDWDHCRCDDPDLGAVIPGCGANPPIPGGPGAPPTDFAAAPGQTPAAELQVRGVLGAFKVPGIRNVALTPPYFHYGGYATLTDMLEFYVRGGNRVDVNATANGGVCDNGGGVTNDSSGGGDSGLEFPIGPDSCPNTGVEAIVTTLNLALDPDNGKTQEYGVEALAAFMKAWTDPRVQCDVAPFDHPELFITHGHDKRGKDIVARLPAVGAAGYDAEGREQFCLPNAGDLFHPDMQNRVNPLIAR